MLTAPALGAVVLFGLPPAMALLAPLWRPYERRAGYPDPFLPPELISFTE